MSIPYQKIFPTYNISLRTPKGSKLKIGSRRLYVDFPYWVYGSLDKIIKKYSVSGLNKNRFESEFQELTRQKIKTLPNSAQFFNARLGGGLAYDNTIILSVIWEKFFYYLDKEAIQYSSKIINSNDKEEIVNMYKKLIWNYEEISKLKISVKEYRWNNNLTKSYIKTLKFTGDYYKLEGLFLLIQEVFNALGKHYEDIFKDSLYTLINRIPSDIYSAIYSIQNIEVITVYFFLRRLIEDAFDVIKKNKKNIVIPINKKMEDLLTNKISGENIKDFCTGIKLKNTNSISNLYIACNQIVHNEHPVEFNSVIEFKVIINLVKEYINSIAEIFVKSFNLNQSNIINSTELQTTLANFGEPKMSKNESAGFKILGGTYKELIKTEIKNILIRSGEIKKNDIFFDPTVLGSIFHLLSPSYTNILNGIFNFQDVYNFIENIPQFSDRFDLIQIFEHTWLEFDRELTSTFNKLEEYSKLNLSNDEKRIVVFYILASNLDSLILNE